MSGSRDHIVDLCEVIESQGFNYFLVIVEPNKDKTEDDITCITSMNEESLENLMEFVRNFKKEQKKLEDKKDKKDKKDEK